MPLGSSGLTSAISLLLSYLFLTDVLRAAHTGAIPCISSSELFMRMPASSYNFEPMYGCLMAGTGPLPADMTTEEDALLLLTAICSDILYAHHAFSSINHLTDKAKDRSAGFRNPYVPLSPEAEALRHKFNLDAALTRWFQHFGWSVSKDCLALYYFCRLVHAVPAIFGFPLLAEYPPASAARTLGSLQRASTGSISDEAMNFAWLIVDNSNTRSESLNTNVSIWLPIVLFYAALTVWYQLQQQESSSRLKTGTYKTLNMFQAELDRLPWSCCTAMCLTLDRLIQRQDDLQSSLP